MAISKMSKIMIVSHRSEANELLEAIQHAGTCEIYNAEQAMISKDTPELCCAGPRPRHIEDKVESLNNAIDFLRSFSQYPKGITTALAPRTVIEQSRYDSAVGNEKLARVVNNAEQIKNTIDTLQSQIESCDFTLKHLTPWESLDIPVEQLDQLENVNCLAGLITAEKLDQITPGMDSFDAIVERVGKSENKIACVIICLKEYFSELQKLLRSAELESANFESMTGTVGEIISQTKKELIDLNEQLNEEKDKAAELAKNMLDIQILYDHTKNMLGREQTQSLSPATDHTVIFEGWTKEKDYSKLEKIVNNFSASSLNRIETTDDEDIPVEIDNSNVIRPFEVVTRLYGMPQHFEVDPTALLAPFFAVFFALCLTDAGYGLLIIAFCIYLIRKMQADKKLIWMLFACSIFTLGAGVMVGGWFGDAAQQLSSVFGWTWLETARNKLMWFDPLEQPMTFFLLAIGLGYIHIMTGLVTAFVHNLRQNKLVDAVCDQLTWLVMLNSIVLFMFGGKIGMSAGTTAAFGRIAMLPAGAIVLFSQREGGWFGRIAMGCYNLFSTIFYMGDVLSYLRLMALGMVTGGLGMAINVMAKTASEVPYVGMILAIIVLVGGHLFNTAISGLSAFVHTIRLQFVEFFPKFLVGGGRLFSPLSKEYKYVYINEKKTK